MAKISDLLEYNPETGLFRLKEPRKCQNTEWFAGKQHGDGYLCIAFYAGSVRLQMRAARVAWRLMTGKWPVEEIDHKNRNRNDNRWENLRAATQRQNSQNQSIRHDSSTGVRGVTRWGPKRFLARIGVNNRRKHLGLFNTLEEAKAARKAAERRYFGEFAPEEI